MTKGANRPVATARMHEPCQMLHSGAFLRARTW